MLRGQITAINKSKKKRWPTLHSHSLLKCPRFKAWCKPGNMMDSTPSGPTSLVPSNNCCLYIRNIDCKIAISHLKRILHMAFARYGHIRSITARDTMKLKGQAWILFDTPEHTVTAMTERQGFQIGTKQIHIDFARSPSNCVD
jgi:RNA recognition motif-containing protein